MSGHISAKNKKTETKRKLKALGDALKFPQSTNRGGKEERATVTPEKKQLEWQNRELLKLEVAAAERQRLREEEMALQAKRKAEDEEKAEEERKRKKRKKEEEEERRAAEKRLDQAWEI